MEIVTLNNHEIIFVFIKLVDNFSYNAMKCR